MKKISPWISSIRPKTLPASIAPVIVGASFAYGLKSFSILTLLVIIICSLLIQISSNYYNEIYDYYYGADNEKRLGPDRSVSKGHIKARTMLIVSIIISIITFILGLYLVSISDYNILVIGVVSLLFAWAYTGGPYPLAYKGLGDLFVLIFFGLIATNGTYYVFSQSIDNAVLISSFIPGILSMNILSANNIRDIETDKEVNKITLAIKLGKEKSILLYQINIILVFLIIIIVSFLLNNFYILLTFISLPLGINLIIDIKKRSGKELNLILAKSALLLILISILISTGILIEKL